MVCAFRDQAHDCFIYFITSTGEIDETVMPTPKEGPKDEDDKACVASRPGEEDANMTAHKLHRKKSLSLYDVLCFATVQAMVRSFKVYLLAAKHSLHICKPQHTIKTQHKQDPTTSVLTPPPPLPTTAV
jgi:hypothetical protein